MDPRRPRIDELPPQKPGVVFQPRTYLAFQRGINQLVGAIRPTLGPTPRCVAIERSARNRAPELLDNGAVIARRIIELPDRDASMGALLLRQALWRLHEKVGDGTATAAVLFQEIFNRGVRYIASGGNAARLRVYLEEGLRVILDELTRMSVQLDGKENLVRIAETICYDHALAEVLGEIMDIVGPYGQVDIRVGYGWTLKREYVEGAYWDGGLYSPDLFINPGTQKAELVEPWILISDLVIEEARQLVPALDCAMGANARTLVVMANQLSEQAIGLLQAVNKDSDKMRVIGVKTPEASTHQRAEILPDMAILLGGRPFFQAAGETLERIKPEDFGQARKAWANRVHFGVVGGKGDPRRLRRHIAKLRAAYGSAEKVEDREHILQRMGKLLGGSATCWIGGMTETETEMRKEAAERMVRALRGAITEGVVPGGGAALLACQPALKRKLEETENADARAAYQILFQSLEAPTRVLVANAGYDASPILGEIRRAGPGCTFDVLQNRIVNAACAGLYDAASVVREAVFSAVSSAALALTIDILVHPRKLKLSMEP